MILTHPNNMRLLRSITVPTKTPRSESHPFEPLISVAIQENPYMPERSIREDWHPPEEERFIRYDTGDESWMRPLGLGRIEEVDEGPLFYEISAPEFLTPYRAKL